MKGVRRFFGNLCGGSRRKGEHTGDASPVEKRKEVDERDAEPTIECNEPLKNNDNENNHDLSKSSHETLEGSPRIHHKGEGSESSFPVQKIFDVAAMTPEPLGITTTDNLFEKAVELLVGFIQESKHFRSVLLNFERRYSKDKRPIFKSCFQVYLRNKEAKKRHEDASRDSGTNLVEDGMADETPEHMLLLIQTSGGKLLATIEETKPQLSSLIEDAEKNDMKDYVKEKIEEEGQQGLLSKFSAPGKYRRNMKQLRKQRKFLDDIFVEVRSILSTIEQEEQQEKSNEAVSQDHENHEVEQPPKLSEKDPIATIDEIATTIAVDVNEIVIADSCPAADQEDIEHLEVDNAQAPQEIKKQAEKELLEDNLEHQPDSSEIPPIVESEINEIVEEAAESANEIIEETENEEVSPKKQENKSNMHNESQVSEQEKADVILPLRPSSPSLSLMKAKLADSWDRLEEGKMVDYGSYLVLDPTANDEALIMRRSRSLDSLSSLGSRRSLSRYGSYEFVTDYEIKIADKSETEKAQKMPKVPPQLKTNAPENPLSQTKISMNRQRNSTSPIYKYTEVDYYPLGL